MRRSKMQDIHRTVSPMSMHVLKLLILHEKLLRHATNRFLKMNVMLTIFFRESLQTFDGH